MVGFESCSLSFHRCFRRHRREKLKMFVRKKKASRLENNDENDDIEDDGYADDNYHSTRTVSVEDTNNAEDDYDYGYCSEEPIETGFKCPIRNYEYKFRYLG